MVATTSWISVDQNASLPATADFSPSTAPGRAELLNHPFHQIGRRRCGMRELIFELHSVPFERTELMKRLHLDPLDILHGRDKSCDAINVCGIVR